MTTVDESVSRQHEDFLREYVENCADAILRIDFAQPIDLSADVETQSVNFFSGRAGDANAAFGALFKDLTGGSTDDRFLLDFRGEFVFFEDKYIRHFFNNALRLDDVELVQTDRNGKNRFLVGNLRGIPRDGHLIAAWLQIRDATHEHESRHFADEVEKNWRLTQKIEALGRLAGGIAHDFNNFLAVMMLQNDMLNLQLPAGSPLRFRTEEMKKATTKAAAMVKQLLAVGRKQTLNPKPTAVTALVQEFAKTLSGFLPENIEVKAELGEDAGVCFVDQKQLVHSLFSLVENSRDAMPEGGTLTVKTESVNLDRDSVLHKSQPEGWFVQITVSDTGTGMDTATLESVFEPFFSTKSTAKGVGLGLATVYGFVKQSKGFIWVESELGRGTSFRIQFPRIDQPA